MRPILRRIAVQGALTALVLGVVGVVFAEVASIWLADSGTRAPGDPEGATSGSDDAVVSTLRARVPLFMAVWGFAFVAVGEFARHWWRSRKPAPPPTPPQPDEAEKLLEELLAKAEAKRAEDRDQRTEDRSQEPARPA